MITFDFFELADEKLLAENYAEDLSSARFVGAYDQYEMAALNDFFASCGQFGLEAENRYVFKIESYILPRIYAHLKTYPFPDNQWHREVQAKLLRSFREVLENRKGILVIA